MKRNEALAFTRTLMASTPCVYLATVDAKGHPQIRAVSNLRDTRQFPSLEGFFEEQDPFVTYLATYSTSAKARQIAREARAALYFCRPERFHGAMLAGSLEVVRDAGIRTALWQEAWRPFWRKGPRDPRYRIYRFLPDGARGWSGEEQFRFSL